MLHIPSDVSNLRKNHAESHRGYQLCTFSLDFKYSVYGARLDRSLNQLSLHRGHYGRHVKVLATCYNQFYLLLHPAFLPFLDPHLSSDQRSPI